MAGLSRPKDGVASLAYVPAIHVLATNKAWMPGTRPGMTAEFDAKYVEKTRQPFASSLKYGSTLPVSLMVSGLP